MQVLTIPDAAMVIPALQEEICKGEPKNAPPLAVFTTLFIAWTEDKALLESNLSAAAGGQTERQGLPRQIFRGDAPLFFIFFISRWGP